MSAPSTAIQVRPIDEIRRILDNPKYREQLTSAVIGSVLSPDKLVRVALTAIQNDSFGRLVLCDPVSLAGSVIQLGQIGLLPDGFLGHAYLVSYQNNKRCKRLHDSGPHLVGCFDAKPMIGYRGYVELAYRSENVARFEARLVYANDEIAIDQGSGQAPVHIYSFTKPRGNLIGAYAVVKLNNGEHLVEPMNMEDIEKVRKSSKASSEYSPWNTHFEEMARKTPARRISKWVPSPKSQLAAAIEESHEAGATRTTIDAASGEILFSQVEPDEEKPSMVSQIHTVVDAQAPETAQPERIEVNTVAANGNGNPTAEPAPTAHVAPIKQAAPPSDGKINAKQKSRLWAIFRSANAEARLSEVDLELKMKAYLKETLNIESTTEIPTEKYDAVCKWAGGDKLKVK